MRRTSIPAVKVIRESTFKTGTCPEFCIHHRLLKSPVKTLQENSSNGQETNKAEVGRVLLAANVRCLEKRSLSSRAQGLDG